MSEMVEQVARGLWTINGCGPDDFSPDGKYERVYMGMARAAIAAMREPTPAMCEAGNDVSHGDYEEESEIVWRAMIDAALGQKS